MCLFPQIPVRVGHTRRTCLIIHCPWIRHPSLRQSLKSLSMTLTSLLLLMATPMSGEVMVCNFQWLHLQGMTIRTAQLPGAGNLLRRAGEDLSGLPDQARHYHFFYWQYHISIQALDFESLWQFLFCSSAIATSVSFYIIKPTDFSVVACDWLASAVKPIRS